MCVCVHIDVDLDIRMHMFIYIYTCHIHMYVCVCVYVYVYVYICIWASAERGGVEVAQGSSYELIYRAHIAHIEKTWSSLYELYIVFYI